MGKAKSYDEKIQEAKQKELWYKEKAKKLQAEKKKDERAKRTRRLIQVGAILESAAGVEFSEDEDRLILTDILNTKNNSGITFGEVIARAYKQKKHTK